MSSVTQRIKKISQPKGGYVNPKKFKITKLEDMRNLNEKENIHPILVGIVVDYLTRFLSGASLEDAFKISLMGAHLLGKGILANNLLSRVVNLEDDSIDAACKLSGFDVCFRMGMEYYKPIENIIPDKMTIENIRILVKRSLHFFELYGPVVLDGFTFQGGYTNTIDAGDGDFLTKDTLWDFKVSKNTITSKHTLQLLVYYLMGKKSIHSEFNSVNKLGVYNPRRNEVAILNISDIEHEVIELVSNSVIGY